MRFLSTRAHGIIDYLMGALLIALPWLLGVPPAGPETWVPVILGVGVIAYSLMTDYELGAVRKIGMRAHLGLDLAGGVLLALSPWLFDFDERIVTPYVVLGILEIGAALVTRTVPSDRRAHVT